ncbi:uncharacterized protein Fot_20019 [Forsythia ovata]|uniref:Uncharacterized protein n=1 Tax=Forsythia ovata TaxID=205694 RepID=A0ABD1VPC5_9LAMI
MERARHRNSKSATGIKVNAALLLLEGEAIDGGVIYLEVIWLPSLYFLVARLSTRAFLDEAECKIQGGLMIGTWEGFCLTFPVAEPCSSETTREADDASPVSVLEAPFTEDFSSESFERVSTELHELQMLLQLLKMESEAYAQVPGLISNQEEVAQ